MTYRIYLKRIAEPDLGDFEHWLPSLAYLALSDPQAGDRDPEAFDHLRSLCDQRATFAYTVVEEIIDGLAAGTISAWPLVDEDGRLRFPGAESDSEHWHRPLRLLQAEVNRERSRLGSLMPTELAARPVEVGDVFAFGFIIDTPPSVAPVLDVTWDAREAGKSAFLRTLDAGAEPPATLLEVGLTAQLNALREQRPTDRTDLAEAERRLEVDERYHSRPMRYWQ